MIHYYRLKSKESSHTVKSIFWTFLTSGVEICFYGRPLIAVSGSSPMISRPSLESSQWRSSLDSSQDYEDSDYVTDHYELSSISSSFSLIWSTVVFLDLSSFLKTSLVFFLLGVFL